MVWHHPSRTLCVMWPILLLLLTSCAKNRKERNKSKKKIRKELSLLLAILTLSPFQGFSSGETNFHFCQFFSNFLRYFVSNFSLSHPYSNFAVYFPGSSFFLYSTLFCHFTSIFNLPSNSFTNSFVFSKSFSFSHVLFSAINPFHRTKYFRTSLIFLWFNIFLLFTSYITLLD